MGQLIYKDEQIKDYCEISRSQIMRRLCDLIYGEVNCTITLKENN